MSITAPSSKSTKTGQLILELISGQTRFTVQCSVEAVLSELADASYVLHEALAQTTEGTTHSLCPPEAHQIFQQLFKQVCGCEIKNIQGKLFQTFWATKKVMLFVNGCYFRQPGRWNDTLTFQRLLTRIRNLLHLLAYLIGTDLSRYLTQDRL